MCVSEDVCVSVRMCVSERTYRKLGSIVTSHSIQKLRIFAPPDLWIIVFMGLITTRLKIQ